MSIAICISRRPKIDFHHPYLPLISIVRLHCPITGEIASYQSCCLDRDVKTIAAYRCDYRKNRTYVLASEKLVTSLIEIKGGGKKKRKRKKGKKQSRSAY